MLWIYIIVWEMWKDIQACLLVFQGIDVLACDALPMIFMNSEYDASSEP